MTDAASLSLRDFVQHKANCALRKRVVRRPVSRLVEHEGELDTETTYEQIDGPGANCTCRLAEVLARESSLRKQIEQLEHYYSPANDRDDHVLLDDVLALVGDDHG